MHQTASKLVLLFAAMFLAQSCFAVNYEELPKTIEVQGIIAMEGKVFCMAQIHEHATLDYMEQGVIENTYNLLLVDSAGNALETYEFLSEEEKFGDLELPDEGAYTFSLMVPYKEGVKGIKINDADGQEKCSVQRSANAPQISITSPASGVRWEEVKAIEWEMSDKDSGDWLLVDVYWADNSGLGWRLLEKQVDGSRVELFEAVKATRIKAIVSDGFNTGSNAVKSSSAQGRVGGEIDFEKEKIANKTSLDEWISFDNFEFQPREINDEDGDPDPWDFNWIDLVFYGVIGIVILFVLVKVAKRGKGKKGSEVPAAQPADAPIETPAATVPEQGTAQAVQKETGATEKHLSKKEHSDAMKVLRKRYAKGEITTEQFRKMKEDLGS